MNAGTGSTGTSAGGSSGGTARATALGNVAQSLTASPPTMTAASPARVQALRDFDALLGQEPDATVASSPELVAYYQAAVNKVAREIEEPVLTGMRVWSLYNMGFIVKTPTLTLAFDLVTGRRSTDLPQLHWAITIPANVYDRIDALFVSHEHGDHFDPVVFNALKDRGKLVIYPGDAAPPPRTTNLAYRDRGMGFPGKFFVLPLYGFHGETVNLMYYVTTEDGRRLLFTGDSGDTNLYPTATELGLGSERLDLLLIAGWVNYPANDNRVSMKTAIQKLNPRAAVPGHFHEFNHVLPLSVTGPFRYAYQSAIQLLGDPDIGGQMKVLTWGESLVMAP